MDRTARDLIQLLHSAEPNLRLAAMRVVTALEMRQKTVLDAFRDSLESENEALKVQALQGLAQLGPAAAVEMVAPMLLEPGVVRQQAARVLSLGGSASVPALRKLYGKADHHGKRAIASTLAEIGGTPAFDFLLRALPGEELEMAKHLTQCLRTVLQRLGGASRLTAIRSLRKFLREPKTRKSPHAVIGALMLLGNVTDPKSVEEARRLLMEFLAPKLPEPVRRNAAISLARLPVPAKGGEALLAKLMPLLCEKEWSPVPQNLLPMLQRLEFSPTAAMKLLPLLSRCPHDAVRIHVLERLRGIDKPAVQRAVLPFLTAEHPRLREATESALKTMPSAIDALFTVLQSRPDGDVTQRVQWILRAFPETSRKKYARRAADMAVVLHEKGEASAAVFVDFACGADPGALQKRVLARIDTVRRGSARDRWSRVAALYGMLDERNLLPAEQRVRHGLALLRGSKKDVRPESRHADPALLVLARAARHDGQALVRDMLAEKSLGAEDYFYVGFHLAEGGEESRSQGMALLQQVVSRYPRHKLRRAAEQKLTLLERVGGQGT